MSNDQLDAQFYRAVEIVQSLPKTGPIQTGYEEKLAMYSLYKQATVGDVVPPRPGIWDPLGRAKWDAWEKQKGLDPAQAKWLYVETLQKVLRKYSDRTVARDLVVELDSYNTDPSGLVMSGTLGQSEDDASSSSSRSASPVQVGDATSHSMRLQAAQEDRRISRDFNPPPSGISSQFRNESHAPGHFADDDGAESDDGIREDPSELTQFAPGPGLQPSIVRPTSSVSRYKTPMASTAGVSRSSTPPQQPMPRYSTPSAFQQNPNVPGPSSYPPAGSSTFSSSGLASGRTPVFNLASSNRPSYSASTPRPGLERTLDGIQASLAALHERIDGLESLVYQHGSPVVSSPRRSSPNQSGPASHGGSSALPFDPNQLGAWSILIRPIYLTYQKVSALVTFLTHSPNPRTTAARLLILRRLFLDLSFLVFLWSVVRFCWRASGLRRREVLRALAGVWHALIGTSGQRVLVDRGV